MFQNDLFERVPLLLFDDPDGGVHYLPNVISPETAHAWFEQILHEVEWGTHRRMMYEREVDVPRLMANFPLDGTSIPSPLLDACEQVRAAASAAFNSVGLNLYRNGDDSVAPHNDKTEKLVEHAPIAILSLGATRRMSIRSKTGKGRALNIDLEAGSVMVMSYASQFSHTHSIPKMSDVTEARISLAFRCIETQG